METCESPFGVELLLVALTSIHPGIQTIHGQRFDVPKLKEVYQLVHPMESPTYQSIPLVSKLYRYALSTLVDLRTFCVDC